MNESLKVLKLPDTMSNWPWPREINPHYEVVKTESKARFPLYFSRLFGSSVNIRGGFIVLMHLTKSLNMLLINVIFVSMQHMS